MSILIRGMEMPKNCTGCPICCGLPYQHRDVKGRRPDCPLVELPPHGRLGDLDKLWNRMYNYIDNEGAKMPYEDNDFMIHRDSACELIEDMPTVIEESET